MWLVIVLCTVVLLSYVAWFAWDSHVRYGPVIPGNARWRREEPKRAAEAADREAFYALTDADLAWLRDMGWKPSGELSWWYTTRLMRSLSRSSADLPQSARR